MSRHPHRILRKRDDAPLLSGSVVESIPNPTASSLAQNSAAIANPSLTQAGIPLIASATSAAVAQSSTSTTTVNPSASPGSQISLGTVIGSCIAALAALLLSVLLAFYCSRRQRQSAARSKSRNVTNDVSRRRSHLEPWKRIKDGADRWEGQEQSMSQRPTSGPLGAMFQRTVSNASGDKSSESHNRESVGTMRHFAKYHPGLAAEMASQGTTTSNVTKPPPVLRLVGRDLNMNPPISWDGETVAGESFMSLHSSFASSTSPALMTTAKSTPPATSSALHRWESAEVVHVDQIGSKYSEDGGSQNPFADSSAVSIKSRRSSTKGQNPFFSGRDHPVKRTLLPDTHKNPFADPEVPHNSPAAIQSLLAALQDPMGGSDRAVSFQSSVYSGVSRDDAESAISVTAFPYPPTRINVR